MSDGTGTTEPHEVLYLLDGDGEILHADHGLTAALPDSRTRWKAIWALRARLAEIAHSHPHGPLAFSAEDLSTMAALEAALGRGLRFSIVAPGGMLVRDQTGERRVDAEPAWAEALRRDSNMIERDEVSR